LCTACLPHRFVFAALRCLLQVDLTLHGHHHSYQRTCPVLDNRCQDLEQQQDHTLPQHSSSSNRDARSFSSRRRQGGPTRVIHDAAAPVHLVIGHAGAELSLNVDLNPPDIWEVSYAAQHTAPYHHKYHCDASCCC
jgi:hypothetical protein